jgi:hypothetical protein
MPDHNQGVSIPAPDQAYSGPLSSRAPIVRPILVATLAAIAACVLLAAHSTLAHAGILDATCIGEESITYSPGLTNTVQEVEIAGKADFSCLSLTDPSVTSGAVSYDTRDIRACGDLLEEQTFDVTYKWNTGATSTANIDYTPNHVDGQLVLEGTGTVISGLFKGATVIEAFTLLGNLDACETPEGLTGVSGPIVLEISSL